MDAVDVYLLGRRLMKIAEAAFPSDPTSVPLPSSVRMVLVDVSEHPGSSISEITARTGFPQSHVSASVARLREQGVLETRVDAADGRRTLVELADGFRDRRTGRRPVPVERALAAELGSSAPDELEPVFVALEVLAVRLIPGALARGRPGLATAHPETESGL